MPNLKTVRPGALVGTMTARWPQFVANFLNGCLWDGFYTRFTADGRNCLIQTVGHTGIIIADRGAAYAYSGEEQKLLLFVDGRCTAVYQLYGPSGWSEGDATNLGPYAMYDGGFVFWIHNFNVGTGTRIQFHDQDGVELYDSGVMTVNLTDESFDIPQGTTSITGTISGTSAGAVVDLATAYKIAA